MSKQINYSSSKSFQEDVLQSSLPVVVDYYSEDCAPCAALAPMFERMAERYGDRMRFVKIFRQENRDLAEKHKVRSSPTLIFFQQGREVGSRLSGFIALRELRQAIEEILGPQARPAEKPRREADLLILGGGPAGLTAGIYAGRAKLNTILIDEAQPGGQAATTYHIANYPGTGEVVRGQELMLRMLQQAQSFGMQAEDFQEVERVSLRDAVKEIETDQAVYRARAVILATGAKARRLPAEGEGEWRGRGIHYCATCDGSMYEGKHVAVIGGGNSAIQEAIFLTRYASKVTIVHEFAGLQAAPDLQQEAFSHPQLEFIWTSHVQRVNGDGGFKSLTLTNLQDKTEQELLVDGAFVYIGMQPATDLFQDQVQLNDYGYVTADGQMRTSVPGVFVAGDVREKELRQVVTATADGAVAAVQAEKFLRGEGKK